MSEIDVNSGLPKLGAEQRISPEELRMLIEESHRQRKAAMAAAFSAAAHGVGLIVARLWQIASSAGSLATTRHPR